MLGSYDEGQNVWRKHTKMSKSVSTVCNKQHSTKMATGYVRCQKDGGQSRKHLH